jgi:hypothetical protein
MSKSDGQQLARRKQWTLAQSLVDAVTAANQAGAKYQVVANQIIGQGDSNTFNFTGSTFNFGALPQPPKPQGS